MRKRDILFQLVLFSFTVNNICIIALILMCPRHEIFLSASQGLHICFALTNRRAMPPIWCLLAQCQWGLL